MMKLFIIGIFVIAYVYADGDPNDIHAETLQNKAEINEDGSYKYSYATSNNIAAQESGVGGVTANGEFSYTAPEGILIKLQYSADENGFKPEGDHLPVPHPVPEAILKSLEYIRTHPHPENVEQHEETLATSSRHQRKVRAPIAQKQPRLQQQ